MSCFVDIECLQHCWQNHCKVPTFHKAEQCCDACKGTVYIEKRFSNMTLEIIAPGLIEHMSKSAAVKKGEVVESFWGTSLQNMPRQKQSEKRDYLRIPAEGLENIERCAPNPIHRHYVMELSKSCFAFYGNSPAEVVESHVAKYT